MENKKMKTVVQGALLLTIAGLISKVLSALYRVPLQNLTGDFGFYIYQQVYPFIGMAIILALYGFPIAISKLTSEQIEQKTPMNWFHFYGPLLLVLLGLNGLVAGAILLLAPFLADLAGDNQLVGIYRFAALMFIMVPGVALLRGLFQGQHEMHQTAYSQIIEQIFRVIIIIIAAYIISLGKVDMYLIGKAGIVGTVVGMLIATVFLAYLWQRRKGRNPGDKLKQISSPRAVPWTYFIYTCFTFGIAASLNQLILIFIQFIDVFTIVPSLLHAGVDPIVAMEDKGIFDRGQPLIQFGVVFGSSFALALFPAVIKANMSRDRAAMATIREAILFGFYIAVGATLGLIFIMRETNILLYKDDAGTFSLQILVIAIICMSLLITVNAILQSLHLMRRTALYIFGAILLKGLLNKLLVPYFGITGSAIATVLSLIFLTIILLYLLQVKLADLKLFRHIHWPGLILASSMMAIFILSIKFIMIDISLLPRMALLVYVLSLVSLGALIFISTLLRYNVLTDNQLAALPFSSVFIKLHKKIGKK